MRHRLALIAASLLAVSTVVAEPAETQWTKDLTVRASDGGTALEFGVESQLSRVEVLVLRHFGAALRATVPTVFQDGLISKLEAGTVIGGGWVVVSLQPVKRGVTVVHDDIEDGDRHTYAVVAIRQLGYTSTLDASEAPKYRSIARPQHKFPMTPTALFDGATTTVVDGGVRVSWRVLPQAHGRIVVLRRAGDSKPVLSLLFSKKPTVGDRVNGWEVVGVAAPEQGSVVDESPPMGESLSYSVALVDEILTSFAPLGAMSSRAFHIASAGSVDMASGLVPVTEVTARPVPNDNGTHVKVDWKPAGSVGDNGEPTYAVLANTDGDAAAPVWKDGGWSTGWTVIADGVSSPGVTHTNTTGSAAVYAVATLAIGDDGTLVAAVVSKVSAPVAPVEAMFNTTRWLVAALVLLMALALAYYIPLVRKNPDDVFIRRIPGVDAIEEAVGRSTEMGRPVLYVTGVEEIQNIQTLASLLCLGPIAEMAAEYDTELKVANAFPLTMVVAEEIVKQGYTNAGRADAHRPENVMFISAEQFAFAAGVNGMMLRDKPATNIYLGRFFAESLILAETGYAAGAIQIAGTAEISQLPFFIAACDYTIIGEELYAVSAYLSRDPKLLATLKATDLVKLMVVTVIVVGAVLSTFTDLDVGGFLAP